MRLPYMTGVDAKTLHHFLEHGPAYAVFICTGCGHYDFCGLDRELRILCRWCEHDNGTVAEILDGGRVVEWRDHKGEKVDWPPA